MTKKQKSLLTRIILGIVLFLAGMILERAVDAPWAYWTAVGLLLMSWLLCGLEIAIKAVKNIGHGQIFDENFLMTLATVGAFALMDFDEGAAVMLFFQVGELFQSIAVERSRRSVAALMDLRPDVALVLRDGEPEECDPEEVEAATSCGSCLASGSRWTAWWWRAAPPWTPPRSPGSRFLPT